MTLEEFRSATLDYDTIAAVVYDSSAFGMQVRLVATDSVAAVGSD